MNKPFPLLLVLLITVCCTPKRTEETPGKQSSVLKLRITAKYNFEIGYGIIYDCHVESVEEGNLQNGKTFALVIINKKYDDYLSQHPTCEVTFKKILTNVEENRLTTDGFIDDKRNGWQVVSLK